MKRITTIAAIALAATTLTGWALPETPAAAPAKQGPIPATPAYQSQQSTNDLFIDTLDDHTREWRDYGTRTSAIELGETLCEFIADLGAAEAMDTYASVVSEGSIDSAAAVGIAHSAVEVLCPEHRAEMREWAQF